MNRLNDQKNESYLEDQILSRRYYMEIDIDLHWKAHIKIDKNTTAHFLIQDDCNYLLIFQKELKELGDFIDKDMSLLKVGSSDLNYLEVSNNKDLDDENSGYYILYSGWPQKYYDEF